MNVVSLVPKTPQSDDKEAIIRYFESCKEAAERGEIIAVLALVNNGTEYVHTRIGFTYESSVGMCWRMQHLLMKDWDGRA